MQTRHGALIFLLLSFAIVGCSKGLDADNPEENELREVWNLYRGGPKAMLARPPGKLEEVRNQRTLYPRGYSAIEKGAIVVAWGTDLKQIQNPESTILAHEKQTPTDGGQVLMADGTIKDMSAQEFQAAPKGKK
jgi:hypothetical protein